VSPRHKDARRPICGCATVDASHKSRSGRRKPMLRFSAVRPGRMLISANAVCTVSVRGTTGLTKVAA
jgi:hypothetical protein